MCIGRDLQTIIFSEEIEDKFSFGALHCIVESWRLEGIKKTLANYVHRRIILLGKNSRGSVSEVCLLWSSGIYALEHFLRAFLMSQNFPKFHIFLWPLIWPLRLPRWEKVRAAEMPQIFSVKNKMSATVDGLNLIKCLVKLYVDTKTWEKKREMLRRGILFWPK